MLYDRVIKLTAKQEKYHEQIDNSIIVRNIPTSMFIHNTDGNLRTEYIERLVVDFGMLSIGKGEDEKYYPFIPFFSGELNEYGLGNTVNGISLNGKYNFSGSWDDFPIMFNNFSHTPDFQLCNRVSNILTEVGISMKNNVKMCRIKPSIAVPTETEKRQAEQIIKDIDDGKLFSILLDSLKIGNGENSYSLVNFADVKDIDKLQYLTKYYDDVTRMFLQYFGIPIQSSGKMAQMNNTELSGYNYYCKIIPIQKMEMRKDFYEKFNKKHGTNWGVEFGEPWKTIMEKKEENANDNRELDGVSRGETDNADSTES